MQNELLGAVAFSAQYARPLVGGGGRESWYQAACRVEAMHLKRYPQCAGATMRAFNAVREQKVFPSQRSTQFGGKPIERNNMRMYNCTFSPCDRPRFFSEAFWLLLSGCGTGFSIRRDDVNRLPRLLVKSEMIRRERRVHTVSDSIEGWAHAVQLVIDSYLHRGYYEEYVDWRFDFSKVRAKGAPISSGGYAPGPEPLEVALRNIDSMLEGLILADAPRLRSIHAFDIVMYLSEAVLSGGVRRSASIAIFDPDDYLMLEAKTGDWYIDHPQRAYANISAGLSISHADRAEVEQIVELAKDWGEPGVLWQNAPTHGTNPCAEIGLFPYLITDPKGELVRDVSLDLAQRREHYEAKGYEYTSGWSVCNLTEINAALVKSREDFLEACEAAAHIGTLQAGYTHQGYLLLATKVIMQNEALLGVSITGMCAAPELMFNPELLEEGARVCIETNKATAKMIGIRPASRVTTIKPSGNTSTVAGTSAGVHPFHARRYIRRMRVAKVNPVWSEVRSNVPRACTDLDDHTGVIAFACSAPDGALTREDDTALNHLRRVRLVFQHWVAVGSAQSRVEGLTHNVSNTCTIKDDEWQDVADFLWEARGELRGVALLGYFGDSAYDQAPYQTVEQGSDSEKIWQELAELDWSSVDLQKIESDFVETQLEPACSSGLCTITH